MESSADPRSFPVHYAALGYLSEGPMHGYELRERLRRGLGGLWRIASSQLYSVLHRLEEHGWADPHVESDAARPARTVYRITPEGARAFDAWVAEPVAHPRDLRVEFLAKLYFLRRRSAEAARGLIDAQVGVLEEADAGLARRGALESDDAGFGEIAASFRRQRLRSTIEWLRESEALLTEVEETR